MLANASAVGGWARGGWVRVSSQVPSSSRPARRSSGCAFARRGHRRCLYPPASAIASTVNGAARGSWVRVSSRVPSFLHVRPDCWCSRGTRPPENCPSGCVFARWGHRRCLYPWGPGTRRSGEWSRPGGGLAGWGCGLGPLLSSRGARGPAGPGGSGLLVSLSVRWAGLPGSAPDRAGLAGRAGSQGLLGLWAGSSSLFLTRLVGVLLGPCRAGGVVGCGVSGRLVRRRCRSGRCAGGTRGRGRTSRWWSPPPAG